MTKLLSFCVYYAFISHYSSLALLVVLLSTPAADAHGGGGGGTSTSFEGVYAWGDSLTDTGNLLLYLLSIDVDNPGGHLPFGQTFFHYPTGRFSDGRVLVDFLAQHVKAPYFLVPYLALNATQINGKAPFPVNFAVAGATALSVDYLNATFNISISVPYSLEKQLEWFSTLAISEDKETFSKALVYFGEIGVNDYHIALRNGFTVKDIITNFVPVVMKVIQNTLEFLIDSGAKYVVIEGGYPIGCTLYTKSIYTNGTIDQYGCVEEVQGLNEVHDKLLKELVYNLTTKYNKDVQFIFFDQLKAYGEILKHPSHYGFVNTIDPCFDAFHLLNLTTTVEACSRPSTYLSWDGVHFTEATQSALFNLFNTRGFVAPYPNFLTSKSF